MSDPQSQVWSCPNNTKHFFKDMRGKSHNSSNAWHFFMRCSRCTAILHQIVQEHKEFGNIIPKVSTFIITAAGTFPLVTKIEEVTDPTKQPAMQP